MSDIWKNTKRDRFLSDSSSKHSLKLWWQLYVNPIILGNQIKDKATQISRLRSELYALENKTPPHNKKSASLDIERQLKIEIQTLERYVDQLQTKHDDLQDENIDISDKVRII